MKKFTARNLPVLTEIAREMGLHVTKCDSKTYDVTPHPEGADQREPIDCDQREALRTFVTRCEAKFAGYDVWFNDRGSWVRVTWRPSVRTESQRNNVD